VESIPGPSTNYFSNLAKELKIYLHIGLAEAEAGTNKYFNTVVAFDPKGKIVAKYRKIHLYQVETKFLSEGTQPVTYSSAFGKVGIVICSDIYSGFPMNDYKNAGLGILALSTSWAQWNTGMSTFEAGAKWVNAYVLAANQMYFPDSGVINPDGTDQSHIRQSNGLAYGYVLRR
jgi:predicted amidohydrolase